MSTLDDLVQALQGAVSSVETAQNDAAQAEARAEDALQAAIAWGAKVEESDALRTEIAEQTGLLANIGQALQELLQRAAALKGDGG